MKRNSIVVVAVLLLLCTGCQSGASESEREQEQEQTPKQEIDMSVTEYQRTFISWDGFTNMARGGYQSVAGNKNGYYFLNEIKRTNYSEKPESGYLLQYYDIKEEEAVTLCSRSDCRHISETCDAYREMGDYLWYQKGYLYYLCNGRDGRELWSCATDGTNEVLIGKIDTNGKICKAMLIHKGYFYATAYSTEETADMTIQLVRMPLINDAAYETLADIPWAWDYAPDTLLTALDNSLWIALAAGDDRNGLYEYRMDEKVFHKIFQNEVEKRYPENTHIDEIAVDNEGTVFLVNKKNWAYSVTQWKKETETVIREYSPDEVQLLMIRSDERNLYLLKYMKNKDVHEVFGHIGNAFVIEIIPHNGEAERELVFKIDEERMKEAYELGYYTMKGETWTPSVYLIGTDEKNLMIRWYDNYLIGLEGKDGDGYGAFTAIAGLDKIMSGEDFEWKVIMRINGRKW